MDRFKSCDHMLHRSLVKTFRKRCFGRSDQIKEFLRSPQHRTEQKSIIKPILEQFPNGDFRELSLLWIAVLYCYEKSAELLVRSGADVNEPFGRHDPQVCEKNFTILHVLVHMDPARTNWRLIRLVIDHGADLEAREFKERTVLHFAVNKGRVHMTNMLLENGADVNAADDDGLTPLLFVANSSKANKMIPLLIKHGADVSAKCRRGENVLHRLACAPGDHAVNLARVLIDKGASLDDRNGNGQMQPIHLATLYGKKKLVELYLDHGADVNAQDVSGGFPLYYAARRGHNLVAEILLKRGANIDQRTKRGRTALHGPCGSAAWPFGHGDKYERSIRLLLCAGADLLAEDYDGKTPFALITSGVNMENSSSVRPIIEMLALKKAHQTSIELKDIEIIERYPKISNYYRECIEKIDKMKSTNFIETCTFFQLLEKNDCQIAALMQNPEFEPKFKLYDLNGFSIYAEDLLRVFERAQKHYYEMLEQENVINEAVYDVLPYVVVKEIVREIFNCFCKNVK